MPLDGEGRSPMDTNRFEQIRYEAGYKGHTQWSQVDKDA